MSVAKTDDRMPILPGIDHVETVDGATVSRATRIGSTVTEKSTGNARRFTFEGDAFQGHEAIRKAGLTAVQVEREHARRVLQWLSVEVGPGLWLGATAAEYEDGSRGASLPSTVADVYDGITDDLVRVLRDAEIETIQAEALAASGHEPTPSNLAGSFSIPSTPRP